MNERPRRETAPATGLAWDRGTLPRALTVLAFILAIVAAGTWWAYEPATAAPLDPYLRLGGDAGAAALARDLSAEFPAGAALPPLMQRLERLGLRCGTASSGTLPCEARVRRLGSTVTVVRVGVVMAQERVVRIIASLENVDR